jgi:hypothetical protein
MIWNNLDTTMNYYETIKEPPGNCMKLPWNDLGTTRKLSEATTELP